MSAEFGHVALAVAAALLDSLWEGALIAGAVWIGLRCLPKLGAATRYAMWLCALVGLVLIPAVTAGLSQRPAHPAPDATVASAQTAAQTSSSANAAAARPRVIAARVSPKPANAVVSDSAASAAVAPAVPASARKSRIMIPQRFALAAVLIWLLAAGARGLRLLLNLRELTALRRNAWAWSTAHGYPVLLSNDVEVPIAVGFARPAIILPAALVERLDPDAVDTIVVHEVAHLRRYDVWTNALARVAEALVVLNPVAWFVMRRLSMEREIACDDWVVARTGAGEAFARTLLDMACRARARAPLAAPSVIGSRHSVVVRIERLLDSRPRRLRLSPAALGGTFVMLALIALVVQSVSPVLAYAPKPDAPARGSTALAFAGSCAAPNRSVRMTSFLGMRRGGPDFARDGIALQDPAKLVAEFGAANVATYDLTVDAAGRPRKVVVVSAPSYPGMAEHVIRLAMEDTYLPALRDCVPVAATVRAGLRFGKPQDNVYSIVAPAYPKGWSTKYGSACKVPTVQHSGVPSLPASMENMSLEAKYGGSVRVRVDAAGAATDAAIVTSTGQKALDDALLTAAREATYPLADSTGFKQARPAGAPLSWNAAHGSDTYANCKPAPAEYVWNTTFGRIAPIGLPNGGYLLLAH